ncbi:UNVERIFIED_CONTAM: hypothetical protein Sradi_0822500 [Sesamum radiatum]|uniref:Uncharacterized protein n=1 Tax=Sesamum radiatum TaxID=300843 RepID=A0AAW2VRA6_SESRA
MDICSISRRISATPPPPKVLANSWITCRQSSSSKLSILISFSMEETLSSNLTSFSRNGEFSSSGFAACSLGDTARLGLSGS